MNGGLFILPGALAYPECRGLQLGDRSPAKPCKWLQTGAGRVRAGVVGREAPGGNPVAKLLLGRWQG